MKYQKASDILPDELVEEIQNYVQGEYLYIPIREKTQRSKPTEYMVELQKRDAHIYTKYLEGVDRKELATLYNLSEASIRRIIIKQRKCYTKMKDKIKGILGNWGIKETEVTQIYDTAWQIGDDFILKVYDNRKIMERNVKITTILDGMEIPVGKIICTKDNRLFAEDEKYYYVLSVRLHGSNIVKIDKSIARKMGEIIADLHLAFKACEEQENFKEASLLVEMKGWIKSELRKAEFPVGISLCQFTSAAYS